MYTGIGDAFRNSLSSQVRQIEAKVELYEGSTLVNTFYNSGKLISFEIERVGDESKFFGYGVFQKINVHIIDRFREINITTANSLVVKYFHDGSVIQVNPTFYVSEVHRDENTNELSVTAYDCLHKAESIAWETIDSSIHGTTNIAALMTYCKEAVGAKALLVNAPYTNAWKDLQYTNGGNLEGSETVKDIMDALAEVTNSIYYIDKNDYLYFSQLEKSAIDLEITKADYFTFSTKTNRRISKIAHITELGDNVIAAEDFTGTTVFLRDNPYLNLLDDIQTILDDMLDAWGGFTLNQYELEWRGNPLLEVLDRVSIVDKNGVNQIAYILNDTIKYDGTFSEVLKWEYVEDSEDESGNPTTLGEALNQTYARVDKANKEIVLLASKTDETAEEVSRLSLTTGEINASVSSTRESIEELTENLNTIHEEVETKVTSTAVDIAIRSALDNGIDKVTTSTGFTFDADGLNITKSNTDISTRISENGMVVSQDSDEKLVANAEGVKAEDLWATTYLIIGKNSRFEDYDNDTRTGCFWIGG